MAEEEQQEEKKGSGKKLIIMIVLGLVVLGVGAGGAILFMGSSEPESEAMAEEMAEEEKMEKMSIYHDLHPAFVANFSGKSNKNYMQVYVVAMAHEDEVIEDLIMHMPAVRNNVLMTLSSTTSIRLCTHLTFDSTPHDLDLLSAESNAEDRK